MIGRRSRQDGSRRLAARGRRPDVADGPQPVGPEGRVGDRQLARSVEGDDPPVHPEVDLDDAPGIAPTTASGRQLEDRPGDLDGVVLRHMATDLDGAERIDAESRRQRPPGRLLVGGWHGEPTIVAGEERGQQPVGAVDVGHAGEAQLHHQAILERPPEPLDAALRLGAASGDGADAELGEGAPDLAQTEIRAHRPPP
jgi:hypothetical protein